MINLLGLSVGITASILIGLHSISILTFDSVHKKRDRIFLSYKERVTPDGTQATYDTWVPMADRLKSTYPSIKKAAMISSFGVTLVKGEEYLPSSISYTNEDLFDIFSFEFSEGGDGTFFPNPSTLLIAESEAKRIFGEESALGKEVEVYLNQMDTTIRYTVNGVFKDFPGNSSLQPEMIVSISSFNWYEDFENNWDRSWLLTWILTDGNTSKETLESQFPELVERIWNKKTRENTHFKLLPLSENYDTRIGDIQDAWLLFFIALGILAIAGINYMNLSTASSSTRRKEIGLRKIMGAPKSQISTQFFAESFLYTTLSVMIGLLLTYLLIPFVNNYFDLELSFNSLGSPGGIGGILLLLIVFTLFSGSYPAIYLAQFRGVEHAVSRVRGIRDGWIRNVLMLVQFAFAILLISTALLIRNHIVTITDKDMGFSEDQLVFIEASPRDFANREVGAQRLSTFKNNLGSLPFVKSASSSRHVPTDWSGAHTFVRPQGWTGDPLRMRFTFMDADFFETFEIPFAQGRSFYEDEAGEEMGSVILNEAAYRAFGFDTVDIPVIAIGSDQINVIGVVEDFHFESFRNEVAPTLHFHRTEDNPVHRYITVRLEGNSINEALVALGEEWEKMGAIEPFRYRFADEAVAELYESERQFLSLVTLFTVISILISVMGLYGLTVFLINRKKKEISIRKVIGASVSQIINLVYREYVLWVVVAILIGTSLSIFFYRSWVEAFFYQTPISSVLIFLSVLIVVGLIAFTAGYHALRAAHSNPVKYLREE